MIKAAYDRRNEALVYGVLTFLSSVTFLADVILPLDIAI